MTGVDGLTLIREGMVPPPPAAQFLGLELLEVEPGRTLFRFTPSAEHGNGAGAVNGGVLAGVVDFATATAVVSSVDIETGVSTANLSINYLSPLVDGAVLCEGRVVRTGRTVAHATATMTAEADGRTILIASAVCSLRRR